MKFNNQDGVVYSTNPNFEYDNKIEMTETLSPSEQRLKISIDRKQRKGKTVTLIEGFVGSNEDLKQLEKKLKSACGVGGSNKDGIIIIQGNMLQKVKEILQKLGYRV